MTNNTIRSIPLFLALILVSPAVEAAQTPGGTTMGVNTAKPTISVAEWLVLGPDRVPLPAFAAEKPGTYGSKEMLDDLLLDVRALDPVAGKDGWRAVKAAGGGCVTLTPASGETRYVPEVAWLAARIRTDRFREMTLTVEGDHPRRAWLDGVPVAQGGTGAETESPEVKGRVELTAGKHLLLVQTILDPAKPSPWSVGAQLSPPAEGPAIDGVTMSLDPVRDLEIADVVDVPRVTSIAMSPDGTMVAAVLSRVPPGSDEPETWFEIQRDRQGMRPGEPQGAAEPAARRTVPEARVASADQSATPSRPTAVPALRDRQAMSATNGGVNKP